MSEELNGIFIDVEVDDAVANDPAVAAKLDEVCPVDIFARRRRPASRSSARTSTSACSATSASRRRPAGGVRIVKLYE